MINDMPDVDDSIDSKPFEMADPEERTVEIDRTAGDDGEEGPVSTVISFADDSAFGHLRDNGHVYTFRASRRAEPDGEVWVSRGRGEPKEFDGTCEEVETRVPLTEDVLDEYADESGFGTSSNWRDAIRELTDGLPAGGFIYWVGSE